jgi:hypothetical protein
MLSDKGGEAISLFISFILFYIEQPFIIIQTIIINYYFIFNFNESFKTKPRT